MNIYRGTWGNGLEKKQNELGIKGKWEDQIVPETA